MLPPYFSLRYGEAVVQEDDLITQERPLSLPINLGLNDGTICPQSCIDVMQQHTSRTSLRHYTTAGNEPLLDVICKVDGVNPDNIYLAHGSGPILKQCVPYLISQKIKSSTRRIARHLISKNGFPIITGHLTYFKVPIKALNRGLTVRLLPLLPENNFKLRVEDVEAELKKGDGLVYICNPNNPTGQLMMEREEIEHLAGKFPGSLFWVDEAYVQYIDEREHRYVSDLVPKYDNLLVSRTFSFAYGLAGVRMGYLLSSAARIKEFEDQVTDYRFGTLQEKLATASPSSER
jgi:histidinol-phosphate aminotransferase